MGSSESKNKVHTYQQDAAKPFDLDEALFEKLGLRASDSKPQDLPSYHGDGHVDHLRDRTDEFSLLQDELRFTERGLMSGSTLGKRSCHSSLKDARSDSNKQSSGSADSSSKKDGW
jgi:hypothetical protein